MNDTGRLVAALLCWAETPINNWGTPYVGHPLDFSPAEQTEFIELVHQPRYVTREEQVAKLREIVGRRTT